MELIQILQKPAQDRNACPALSAGLQEHLCRADAVLPLQEGDAAALLSWLAKRFGQSKAGWDDIALALAAKAIAACLYCDDLSYPVALCLRDASRG